MVVNQGWARPGCQGVPFWEKAYVLISQGGKLQSHDLQIRIGTRNRYEFQGIYFFPMLPRVPVESVNYGSSLGMNLKLVNDLPQDSTILFLPL